MQTIDYKHEIYKIFSSSCTTCRNQFDKEKFTCKAFPEGIPDIILSGDNPHNSPLKEQGNDIVFDQKEKYREK